MPGTGGFEATRQIQRLRAVGSIPGIALAARALPRDRDDGVKTSRDDFLGKPIRQDALRGRLERRRQTPAR